MFLMLLATIASAANPAKELSEANSSSNEPAPLLFSRQFGIGISAVPAQLIVGFFPNGNRSYAYTGGMQIDLYGRLHPKISLEFSLAGLGFKLSADSNWYVGEFAASLGARFFFISRKLKPSLSIHPYIVTALRLNAQVGVLRPLPIWEIIDPRVLIGFIPGIGFELRWKEHISFSMDVRTLLGVSLYEEKFVPYFVTGISTNVGISYYF